jgi:hypothetical protein
LLCRGHERASTAAMRSLARPLLEKPQQGKYTTACLILAVLISLLIGMIARDVILTPAEETLERAALGRKQPALASACSPASSLEAISMRRTATCVAGFTALQGSDCLVKTRGMLLQLAKNCPARRNPAHAVHAPAGLCELLHGPAAHGKWNNW